MDGPLGEAEQPGPADGGPEYPSALEHDAVTLRGLPIHVRPIRPTDDVGLDRFHRGLSDRSVYRRFFFVHPALSPIEVHRFTNVDYADRLALVAVDGDRIVAVGRYERAPGTAEAEVAFVVTDDYQHQGIGTTLLAELVTAALDRGITTFTAQTLAENLPMLAVFHGSGFPVTTTTEFETVSVRFPIYPEPPSGTTGR